MLGIPGTKTICVYQAANLSTPFPNGNGPTNGGAVLRSKLVDWRCRVRFLIMPIDLTVRNFPCFSLKPE